MSEMRYADGGRHTARAENQRLLPDDAPHAAKRLERGRCKLLESERLDRQNPSVETVSILYQGKPIDFKLCNLLGMPITDERRYEPYSGDKCQTCGMKPICNGCTHCGKCEQ